MTFNWFAAFGFAAITLSALAVMGLWTMLCVALVDNEYGALALALSPVLIGFSVFAGFAFT